MMNTVNTRERDAQAYQIRRLAASLTDEEIRAVRADAVRYFDSGMIAVCDRALAGSNRAKATLVRRCKITAG
jgi:hypothetical protein